MSWDICFFHTLTTMLCAAQKSSPPKPRSRGVSEEARHQVILPFYHSNAEVTTLYYRNWIITHWYLQCLREFRDYVQWLKGNYVPTESKLRSMVESGFVFPESCKSILKPMEVIMETSFEYTLYVQCNLAQVATPMDYFQFHSDADEEVGLNSSVSWFWFRKSLSVFLIRLEACCGKSTPRMI